MKKLILFVTTIAVFSIIIIAFNEIYTNAQVGENKPCNQLIKRDEIENCLQKELEKSDSILSKKYQNAIEDVSKFYKSSDVENLKNTQKIWLSYRETNCKAEQDLYGEGTDAVASRFSCQIILTNQRIKELNRIYGKK